MEGQRVPQRREGEHVAAVEMEAIVLDFMNNGYFMDPHTWHREKPVAQAIGVRKFSLLDGIPLRKKAEPMERVALARETLKSVVEPLDPLGRRVRRFDVSLACMPGVDRKVYCTTLYEVNQRVEDLVIIALSDQGSNLVFLREPSDLSKVAKSRGLSEKILATPRTPISYRDLSEIAKKNLPEAVKAIIRSNERLFVEFFNIAEPINIRLHSIELLKGVGKKSLKNLIYLRKTKKFESFEDIKKVLKADPLEMLSEKILEEVKGEAKYYLFVEPRHSGLPYLNYLDAMRKTYRQRDEGKSEVT